VLPIPLYYISITVYIVNDVFTNLIHVTTTNTSNIMETVLVKTVATMYTVGSTSVNIK
jgi:hypothetical protein